MLTIIIGKSCNLSKALTKKIKNIILISSLELEYFEEIIKLRQDEKFNIIFNQFQKSSKLKDISEPLTYINRAITSTATILDYVKNYKLNINKIIYTSSSSVYGNNFSCSEDDNPSPLNIHASLKVANEKLIETFCIDMNIDFTITRIFNMYGGDDTFSIISKIIECYKDHKPLSIINNGESIRDYIHISDVVTSYTKILTQKNLPIINIGRGEGKSLLFILNYLEEHEFSIEKKHIKRNELKISISQNNILLKLCQNNFTEVEDYLLGSLEPLKKLDK